MLLVVFHRSPEQQEQALASKVRVQARYAAPVVTEIEPAEDFWRAEDCHQQYLVKRDRAGRLI
jgi:peptide-methionine (S)-S-oxide reductase